MSVVNVLQNPDNYEKHDSTNASASKPELRSSPHFAYKTGSLMGLRFICYGYAGII